MESLGEPLPEQMGFFLEGLVGSLAPRFRQCPEEVSEWFADGFEKIGWDVVTNAPVPGRNLEDSVEVLSWLDKAYSQANVSHLKLIVGENGEHEWVCDDESSDEADPKDDGDTFSLVGALEEKNVVPEPNQETN
eukprot:TRINITY_DN7252_c0_g1_i1.p1 TRINITY_DN7252_c0_g1~~TRINITY_DN7252_c0_g1_i1.p1  ORF type:complete len:134 (+),score=21.08 TRINITY_DN7252_c0_g1_i1:361-762(+)